MRTLPILAVCLTACSPISLIPEALTDPERAECQDGPTVAALGACALKTKAALDRANFKLTCIGELAGHEGKDGQCTET